MRLTDIFENDEEFPSKYNGNNAFLMTSFQVIKLPKGQTVEDYIRADIKSKYGYNYVRECHIEGFVAVDGCKWITDLNFLPESVKNVVRIENCSRLESLKGFPDNVGGRVTITNCPRLKSLDGLKNVNTIYLETDGLTSLKSIKALYRAWKKSGKPNLIIPNQGSEQYQNNLGKALLIMYKGIKNKKSESDIMEELDENDLLGYWK